MTVILDASCALNWKTLHVKKAFSSSENRIIFNTIPSTKSYIFSVFLDSVRKIRKTISHSFSNFTHFGNNYWMNFKYFIYVFMNDNQEVGVFRFGIDWKENILDQHITFFFK